ncbi:MAG: response regulator [Lachnospiraceae bacterium]|nr:response regulator [Lachnospiraceae bacterium]
MNILIVDDERYIVNYLLSLVEENIKEEVYIEKAYSAPEALNVLSATKIDLILLDIHMPGCTGLELAKKVKSSWPRCHIIFLTAYDNFEYVYQANHFTSTSYLLKTESDETILTEIQKHIDLINQESQTAVLINDARNKDRLLTHLLQQNILMELVSDHDLTHMKNELQLTGSDFQLDLSKPVYMGYMSVHLRTIDEYPSNLSSLILAYLGPIEKLLNGSFCSSVLNLKHGRMLLFFQPNDDFRNAVQSELAFLKGFAEDLMNYSVTVLHWNLNLVLYPDAVKWNQVSNTYYQLIQHPEIQNLKTNWPSSSVTVYTKKEASNLLPKTSPDAKGQTERQLQALSFSLYQNTPAEYYKALDQLAKECCTLKSMHSLDAIHIYLCISTALISHISLYHLQEKLAARIAVYPLYHLAEFTTWDEAFRYLKEFSKHMFDLLSANASDKSETVIRKIKDYIKEHLSESISLSSLSAIVNYNETYISRLFKQSTGVKLSEYIYQERIAKAKYLLSTSSDSMQAIAAAIGFDSPQYFSLVFKKSVGITPSEYQRIHYHESMTELPANE